MVVCLCKGVCDRSIKTAINQGATTLEDVARACRGAGTGCGSCRPMIADLIHAAAAAGCACAPSTCRCPSPEVSVPSSPYLTSVGEAA